MGTSQSRTSSTEGSSAAIDRLKRYSRADLKLPLKSAFGRQQQQQQQQQPKDTVATTATAGHGAKPGGTESTPASDYETPIYETGQTRATAAAVRYIGGCVGIGVSSFLLSSYSYLRLLPVPNLRQWLPLFPAR